MPTRIVLGHRTLVIRCLGLLWLVATATFLICEPAIAQAPKPKAGKSSTAGKDKKAAQPKKPPAPKPEPDEVDAKPEKREDPYSHVRPDTFTKQQMAGLKKNTWAALKAGAYENDEQRQSLQTYYRKLILPSWTLEENYYMLPKFRNDLRNELRQGKNGDPHTDALTLLLAAMQRIASENFHPAVRYNAMLAIGDFNEQEPVGINGVPTPLPDAVPILVAALTDEKQIDAVKVAALVGLVRHARLGIADQQLVAQRLVPALIKLAAEKTPPATRSADGHEWMRCMAIDVLGLLRNVGDNNLVAKALATIVADKKDVPEQNDREMLVRCAAARALGNLNYANASGLNPVSLAESLAGLAVEACGRGTTSVSSEDAGELPIVRRRLRTEINTVILGLNGVDERHKGIRGLAQDSPNKDHVERLQQRVQNMALAFDKKDPKDAKKEIDDSELAKALAGEATAITQLIVQRTSGAAPAGDGAKPADDTSKPTSTEETPKPPTETPKKPETKGF